MNVPVRVALVFVALLAQTAVPLVADGATAFWSAAYTRELMSFEGGDRAEDAERPFTLAHRFLAQSAGWPMTTTVTTSDPPSELRAFPAVVPALGPDGRATYSWSGSGFLSSSLRDTRERMARPGFSATRALSDGREIPAGETVTRRFDLTIEVGDAFDSFTVTIVFQPSFSPPGSDPLPVSASSVACPGGEVHPSNPAWFNWFGLAGVPGSVIRLSCTADLTNASGATALYTPGVEIMGFTSLFDVAGGRALQAETGPLGITYTAEAPAGAEVSGTLTGSALRWIQFTSENRTPPPPTPQTWTGDLARIYRASTAGDLLADEARTAHWSFSVNANGASWPARIEVTTPLDPALLQAFPAVTPVSSGTEHVYTWSGETPADPADGTPLFGASLFSADGAVDGELGFTIERHLSGGRIVPAGATESRDLTLTLTVTGATQGINVNLGFTGFAPPGALPLPVTATDVSCPGFSDFGFVWVRGIASPTVGSIHTLTCTLLVTNGSDADASYMPSVFIWSTRSLTLSDPQPGATRLEMTDDALGRVAFEVMPPAGTRTEGRTFVIEYATTNMFFEDRELPRATTLEILTAGRFGLRSGAMLEARLTNTRTGSGVAGRKLWFELERDHGALPVFVSPLVLTDPTGTARFTPPPLLRPGMYSVRAVFAGDEAYLRSEDRGAVLITGSVLD